MSRQVRIAALIWGGTALLSRVIGLVREAAIGRVMGASGEADVYFTAFNLGDWINYLVAGGALGLVLIPLFAGHLARKDEAAAWRSFSAIANVLGLLVLGLVSVAWVAAPALAPLLAPGFSADQQALLVHLTRILLPAQVFHILGGILGAALQARDKHGLAALSSLVYAGSVVAGGVGLGTAEGFAWGALAGAALGPFGLTLYGNLRLGMAWRPGLDLGHPDLRTYLARSLPIMVGQSIVVWDDWILRHQGSQLGEGVVSLLNYGKTLMKVPLGVFGVAAGMAAYPTLARLVAEGRPEEAGRTLATAVRGTLALALGAGVALTVAGAEVAAVVYGERLSVDDRAQIGVLVGLFCLGLWAWSAQSVIARGYYALGRTWQPTLIGTVVLLAALPAYSALGSAQGAAGLALCSSLAISAYTLALLVPLHRQLPGSTDGLGLFALRCLLPTAGGLGVGLGLGSLVSLPHPLLQGAMTGGAALLTFLALGLLVGIAELRSLFDKVARRLPGRAGARP